MMSESFDAVSVPVRFLYVNTMCVPGPRSKQLNAFGGHFDHEFVGQVASSEARIVVYSEDVHEVVLNGKLIIARKKRVNRLKTVYPSIFA
jgi:hypothetical protein